MEVRKWMKHPVHMVKPLDSIQHARELMEKHRVNQAPVVVDGRLVGIVTDRDLRDAFPSVFDSPILGGRAGNKSVADARKLTVEMVMTSNVTTVAPGDSMVDAVRLMRQQRINALPVVEGNRVAGLLTRSDVLDGFIDLAETDDERASSTVEEEAAPTTPPASQPRKPASRAPKRRQRSSRA